MPCKKSLRPATLFIWALVVAALFFISGAPPSLAGDHDMNMMSRGEKAASIEFLRQIDNGQWRKAQQGAAQINHPLAMTLYQWLYFLKHDDQASFRQIAAFIRAHPDWPLQGRLQLAAEIALNDETALPEPEIIEWYSRYAPRTPDGMARYLEALARQGQHSRLRTVLGAWWRTALLTPAQQKDFLRRFGRYLDKDAHIARYDNMIYSAHYTNARALARLLGRGYPALVEARIALAENAAGVDGLIAGVSPHLRNDPGLLYERLRWRRRHDKDFGAMEILHNAPPADRINNPAQWWRERHILARRLIERKNYESAYLLVAGHRQKEGLGFAQAEFLAGWLALRFLDKPWEAFEHFETLYKGTTTPISRARGAYWAGRASMALGYADIATKWYQTAARHQTTYYGQLAMSSLDNRYRPPQRLTPQRTVEGELRFERHEMVQAVRLLHESGRYRAEVSSFLDALAGSVKSAEDYLLVADLAQELEQPHKAIYIARKGLLRDIVLMDHAYPTLLSRMRPIKAEWALVHALIRQESAFDVRAQSHAGARGLMQLMPATAKEVAHKKGWAYRYSWLTERPDLNIRLGSAYFEQMLARYDGSYPLALAAYNGGPGRVDRWLDEIGDPRAGDIDMIDWIELIPVYETRNYVQRVLEGVYIYRVKLRDVQQNAGAPIHVAYNK